MSPSRVLACSQEVRNGRAVRHGALPVVHGKEDLERAFKMLIDLQDGCQVVAAVAVVGGRPDRNQGLAEPVLEAIHHKLMGACHKLEVVDVIELMRHSRAEEPASAARRQRPRLNVLGVRPHQIREGAFVRQLHPALEQANLVERLDVWRQAGVHAKDLAFNDGSDAQVVKDVTAVLPWVGVSILSDRLIVESVCG